MKDKKYKYLEDVVEEYLGLKEEQVTLTAQVSKTKEKYEAFLKEHDGDLKEDDAQHAFKLHNQLKKYAENKREIEEGLVEVEGVFRDFLLTVSPAKITFERKDDHKNKTTILFWLEGDHIKSSE